MSKINEYYSVDRAAISPFLEGEGRPLSVDKKIVQAIREASTEKRKRDIKKLRRRLKEQIALILKLKMVPAWQANPSCRSES